MARTKFQDSRVGNVRNKFQGYPGVLLVQVGQGAHPVEHPDDLLFDLIGHIVAVEVLQCVGLESTIQPRRVGATPWHRGDRLLADVRLTHGSSSPLDVPCSQCYETADRAPQPAGRACLAT
ncbi:Uncharacterised protein [Mycobacterium tuberculosis]|nr:Uncharacterised protein [Mycobacterium tuberculosis]COY02889.1 Uncharacterised protein [Mycobacterium tuberculosis]